MTTATDDRQSQLSAWAANQLETNDFSLEIAAADASFRRYFRLRLGGKTWVVMDAPPEHEDVRPFIALATKLRRADIHAPAIHAYDLERGFVLLEDLGEQQFADVLSPESADDLYWPAFNVLAQLSTVPTDDLPRYDARMLGAELSLFPEWCVQRQWGQAVDEAFDSWWRPLSQYLIRNCLEQPQVMVHRDFHCGNLMVSDPMPGVIDFQDAVAGPAAYDLASLLWDRYQSWPRNEIERWSEAFRQDVHPQIEADTWQRWVDLTGLQRNLKVVGIFARLHIRDGKEQYLGWQPRFAQYAVEIAARYAGENESLTSLHRFMTDHQSCWK